ncbi:hypothetical protein YDYSY3_38440 [Paenibacillus chitinolyticus]|uniref:hypothetical protein n=1 Tax=Paenibacillus chitinolyticus TaxID=79263 RepID=UPI0026E4E171|nr:hypothetical protein [Paenibacillus chitinolyticus]GKS12844.1 hypothetical protein YDYSY3_38440 [Paenibacillus chitinolyticus]
MKKCDYCKALLERADYLETEEGHDSLVFCSNEDCPLQVISDFFIRPLLLSKETIETLLASVGVTWRWADEFFIPVTPLEHYPIRAKLDLICQLNGSDLRDTRSKAKFA